MRYWWVNQNQTYRHEVPGGYMWSPKRKSNDHRNPHYDFMRIFSPGDLLISPVAHRSLLEKMGVETVSRVNVGASSLGQKSSLEFHRERVFLDAPVDIG